MFIISCSAALLLLNSASPLSYPASSLKITRTSPPPPPPPNSINASFTTFGLLKLGGRKTRRKWRTLNTVASPATTNIDDDNVVDSAAEVVRNFYGRINAHDVDSVHDLIAENCVYEDLVFPRPFVGRQEILEFFKKFTNSTSKHLQFVIDDLSTEDSASVGVIWHLEWKGKPFPFSKGCSFYRLEVIHGKRQITNSLQIDLQFSENRYGRDSVEPAIKPGDAALAAIRSVTWLLQQFPQLADRL